MGKTAFLGLLSSDESVQSRSVCRTEKRVFFIVGRNFYNCVHKVIECVTYYPRLAARMLKRFAKRFWGSQRVFFENRVLGYYDLDKLPHMRKRICKVY